MNELCIDTFAHHTILGDHFLSGRFARIKSVVGDPLFKSVYLKLMSGLNRRDNLGNPDQSGLIAKNLTRLAFTSNLPFAAQMRCEDLLVSMRENEISHSILCNLEPYSSADSSARTVRRYPRQFFMIAHFSPTGIGSGGLAAYGNRVVSAFATGAKGIYVHPILDRQTPDCDFYHEVARACAQADLPMVCRTGATHYSSDHNANLADALAYESLIRAHPRTRFVLTHSNLNKFADAIALAQRYENIWLDTAWQTQFSIASILESVGSTRVLFASDWPILGNQQEVQKRILSKVKLTAFDRDNIFFKNALALYRLDTA